MSKRFTMCRESCNGRHTYSGYHVPRLLPVALWEGWCDAREGLLAVETLYRWQAPVRRCLHVLGMWIGRAWPGYRSRTDGRGES